MMLLLISFPLYFHYIAWIVGFSILLPQLSPTWTMYFFNFMPDDREYAYTQCCFAPLRHCFELLGKLMFFYMFPFCYWFCFNSFDNYLQIISICSILAFSMVSHRLLCSMDGYIRHFSVDHSCLCLDLVILVFVCPSTSENLSISFPIMMIPFVTGGHTHFLTSHHHLLHYGMPCFLKHLIVIEPWKNNRVFESVFKVLLVEVFSLETFLWK